MPVRSSRRPPRYDRLLPTSSGGASREDARHPTEHTSPPPIAPAPSTAPPKATVTNAACATQVEKQEKKKVPKGRAKKRVTYTRRFVNVVMTGGKRKMNPNPTS